ncbi:MAG TPA: proton-conducting transporter membrane subunit [Steroidobacteraceae bacterium]|nr:proton-conducting transporter membrane subunit [Steroidobacteraceae bacterium]
MPDLLIAAFCLWVAGIVLALARAVTMARLLIALGAVAALVGAVSLLPPAAPRAFGSVLTYAGHGVRLNYSAESLWLMGFGLFPAALAVALLTPVRAARAGWLVGAGLSLIGALGVFGVQDGYSFLVAWELMSLGGAVMILSERLSQDSGGATLYMLALLEAGTVAVMLAILLWAQNAGGSVDFAGFLAGAGRMPGSLRMAIGLLVLVGFGAKLGLLPFYEWFPGAYATGSGATGALMSGVVLNAAFFALSRALIDWLPGTSGDWLFGLGIVVVAIGVLSSILAVLYAFQQDDWRRLLSFSSAENAAIAVAVLGACLLFREDGHADLAGLAWTVAVLHLCGHSLAKGGLFLCADGVHAASGGYRLAQRGWLRPAGLAFGVGALFTAMSLAAMPPQIGFATEWLVFQTLFQGFHLSSLAGRLVLALAGAGVALTAAVAFATFVKVLGIGLLGAPPETPEAARGVSAARPRVPGRGYGWAVLSLGLAVLVAAAGLPLWLKGLDQVEPFGAHSAIALSSDWLIVPLTSKFAFISPSKLAVALPLLAILPLLLALNLRRHAIRRTRVWYGGMREDPLRAATTSLTFANAMRVFYSFIYRPTLDTARAQPAVTYFVRKLEFDHAVADVFGPLIFAPVRRLVWSLAGRLRALQSGNLNFYLALIGALLIVILALTMR